MSIVYDNWERLVEAVLKREQFKRLALCESFSSISTDVSSRFSSDSFHENFSAPRISSNTVAPQAPSGASSTSHREIEYIEFEEIKKATKNFRPDSVIGRGRYRYVFKGWIDEHTLTASKPRSGMIVAVSREFLQGLHESMKYLDLWSQLRHPNLVRLIGYCCEGEAWYWICEFMPEGSLDDHLFKKGRPPLFWKRRIKIAIDAARGLSFLHDREIQVIHRDVTCSAILLDGEYNAKLCHFDLARYGPTGDKTHITTQVIGTLGYVAPEYFTTGQLKAECDVYSFGVVLLELLSGLRVHDFNRGYEKRDLVKWAKPYLGNKEKWSLFMDAALLGHYPKKAAYKVATLASQCLCSDPKQRPRMAEVLERL